MLLVKKQEYYVPRNIPETLQLKSKHEITDYGRDESKVQIVPGVVNSPRYTPRSLSFPSLSLIGPVQTRKVQRSYVGVSDPGEDTGTMQRATGVTTMVPGKGATRVGISREYTGSRLRFAHPRFAPRGLSRSPASRRSASGSSGVVAAAAAALIGRPHPPPACPPSFPFPFPFPFPTFPRRPHRRIIGGNAGMIVPAAAAAAAAVYKFWLQLQPDVLRSC